MKRQVTTNSATPRATSKKTKKKSTIAPPSTALTLIPGLPQDLIVDKLATWGGFLDLKSLMTLSLASRGLYAAMNNDFWRPIAEDNSFATMSTVKSFAKLKPRARISWIISKRICIHCEAFQMENIRPLRPKQECLQVCRNCVQLPLYAEIKYSVAMSQFKLKRVQLDTIPSRKKWVSGGYNRLYMLRDVLRLVEQVKAQNTPALCRNTNYKSAVTNC
ncbi:Aste57867_8618 [Aphanomyces stellatus]|uniref:Aste57867_8618 protein n=1 Tax=Aphanomyces stellatus TaxID=120398 RepID=A0A485KKU0_9STRA|nr:hypothetical protein As57867_008584 [Aphanomyces stellatus]VFT85504.1 Aste57867_8618 [Aphanomyces stellatus]